MATLTHGRRAGNGGAGIVLIGARNDSRAYKFRRYTFLTA
jgi:hypothetical protein